MCVLLQGDTLENVSKELDCIMSTGYFELIVVPKQNNKVSQITTGIVDECNSKVLLHYQPKREHYHQQYISRSFVNNKLSTPPSVRKNLCCTLEQWNSEQIDEFVRKLGFLEAQKVEQPVKRFQQLNQVSMHTHECILTSVKFAKRICLKN